MEVTILKFSAIIALVPTALIALRGVREKDLAFWSALAVAAAGPLAWVYVRQSEGWHTGISAALWLVILACVLLHGIIALASRQGWKLSVLLFPYLIVLALLAVLSGQAPERPLTGDAPLAWIASHIVVSVITYGLVTLAAVAALAATLQERALKSRHPTRLSRRLPSMADSETLLVRLLVASETILVLGVLTGMATSFQATGVLFVLDHKTIFTFAILIVVAGLLYAHFRTGVRGRAVARTVLLAYLLLTLGYPGVKFVTGVLLT
jgi:ABC-type uncharacterized transport system permease subunit